MSENSAEKATTDTATPKAPRAMRRANREVTDPADLAGIIGRAHVLHVGFSDAEGLAVVPMNYGFEWAEGQGLPTFWLRSAGEGRKADAWASSPEVALELYVEGGVITGDYSCAYSYAYESVMAWGRIRPVTDAAEKLRGLTQVMAHMAPGAPVTFSDEAVARVAVWRIDVERISGKRREVKAPKARVPGAANAAAEGDAMPVPDGTNAAAEGEVAPAASATSEASPFPTTADGGPKPKKGKRDKKDKRDKHDDKHEKPKKDKAKKKGRKDMGLFGAIEARLTGKKADSADEELKRKKKADRKALEKAIEEILKGQRCDGCGHHCKLIDPRCGKGKKLRAKRLAKAGIRE